MRSIPAQLALVAALLVGCGNTKPTISVTANPPTQRIPNTVTITITGTSGGQPFQDGMDPAPVATTDIGSFTDPSTGATTTADENTVTGHAVTLTLYPPTTPGTAHVTATYTDPYGTQVSATTAVVFTTGSTVEGLTFSCVSNNIGAFAYMGTDMSVLCTATAFDANQLAVVGANIGYLAEAGSMQTDPDTGNLEYVPHTTVPGANAAPKDVAPLGDPTTGEPRWVDTSTPGSPTRNPRDGLCTLVAWVPGDAVGGLQGEPFVDADDSGAYEVGEDFVDLNHNGVWDSTQTTAFWVQTKILWSGALSTMPLISPVTLQGSTSYNMSVGAQITLDYTLLDENFNVLAASDPMDNIAWMLTPSGDLATVPVGVMSTPLAVNKFGIDMDDQFNIFMPDQLATYEQGAQYSLTLVNATSMSDLGDLPESWSVQGTLSRTLWLENDGTDGMMESGEMTILAGGMLTQ